jgi:hypothetical protein
VRLAGLPRKVYLRKGEVAEAHAQAIAEKQQRTQAEREAFCAEQKRVASVNFVWVKFQTKIRLLLDARMLLSGFHRRRGEWRGWRNPVNKENGTRARSEPAKAVSEAASRDPAALQAMLSNLVAQANTGDRQALTELRHFMDRHPEIEESVGDLARMAESAWLDLLVGQNKLARESVQRLLVKLKRDLAGQHPTDLEKLLVDDIGICYLAKRQAEIAAAGSGGSLTQAAIRFRRAESAQRRFLSAVKTLTNLRALVPEGLAPLNPLRLHPEGRKRA